jgi:CRP/FNR family transcriptional regulator
LPPATRRLLLSRASERQFKVDEVIYLAGSEATSLYLVIDGRVRLLRGQAGRAVYIHDELPGGALGEVPLFEGTTYPATAIAAEPTRCLVLDRAVILDAIRQQPDLALAVLARLAGRIRLLVDRLDAAANRSTTARLADFLLVRAETARGRSFTLGNSQQQAAEEIGTVREVVVRGLKAMREQGAIESRGGGRYVVKDMELLRRVARSG